MPPVKIHLTSSRAPALVALRDGFDAGWQVVSLQAPTSGDVEVHGPYTVTVVCDDAATTQTWQVARTPDDSLDLVAPCDVPPVRRVITGHMVQAGSVSLGDSSDHSDAPDWQFELSVPDGTYDLIATDIRNPAIDQRIAVRRGLAITADLAVDSPIDLAKNGTALSGVVFTLENPAEGEALLAAVDLGLNATSPATPFYLGSVSAAKVAPDTVLMASDVQRVTLQGQNGIELRSMRRPFRIGDDAAFTLPPAIHGALWVFDDSRLSVALPSLPELDVLRVSATGSSSDGKKAIRHDLYISADYLATTKLAQPILDTTIPSYQPAWDIDFARSYLRTLDAQHAADGALATSSTAETIDASSDGSSEPPHRQ